ncbi:sensor histidine kinase [Streptomyces sp. NPDC004134]|uniref:sensor histidine kinase n=1 Tax=Streptomyces sp. NPDC004134 TaxID=3364691 RepID=UPI0036A42D44
MPLPVRQLRLPQGRAADTALAAGTGALVALGTVQAFVGQRREPWATTALGWALIALACGALYFARRRPVAVGAFVVPVVGVYYVSSAYDGPLFVVLVIALYCVAAAGRLRAAAALGALVVAGTAAGTLSGNDDVNGIALFMLTGWVVAVVALGAMWHGRRAHVEGEARRRATEERLRIARELHDVIGHNISLINVQSGAALHRLKKSATPDPAAAGALAAIKETSRETLRELRTTLGVLRQVDDEAPTAPAPGLARLRELTERAADTAGLRVKTVVEGAERTLPAELDLTAYRVVQESLTNVARHARGATSVTVRLDYGDRELRLAVEDDGRGAAAEARAGGGSGAGPGTAAVGGGSGIGGMRERARAVGGELAAGPRPGGAGFAVTARLPYGTEHAQA